MKKIQPPEWLKELLNKLPHRRRAIREKTSNLLDRIETNFDHENSKKIDLCVKLLEEKIRLTEFEYPEHEYLNPNATSHKDVILDEKDWHPARRIHYAQSDFAICFFINNAIPLEKETCNKLIQTYQKDEGLGEQEAKLKLERFCAILKETYEEVFGKDKAI